MSSRNTTSLLTLVDVNEVHFVDFIILAFYSSRSISKEGSGSGVRCPVHSFTSCTHHCRWFKLIVFVPSTETIIYLSCETTSSLKRDSHLIRTSWGTSCQLVILSKEDVCLLFDNKTVLSCKWHQLVLSRFIFLSLTDDLNDNHRLGEGVAPSFAKKPAIRQEEDGSKLLFECKVKSNPKPGIRWEHDSAPVESIGRFKVRNELSSLFK